jgi:hypothetical protein
MVDGVYVTPVSGKPPIPEDIAPTGAIMGYYNKQHATIAAFQPTLQCGCRQVEKSDEHQDFMLAPGKYLVSMQRLIAVPGATAAQRTTWYKTVRVEVVSGSVSPVVWNHDNPTEYGSVTMETDPDTPSITPVYLYSGPAARWREALSGAQNAGTGIEGEYFTGFTDGKSAVFHYVPPGSYTVAVRVGSGRAATAQVRVSVGVVTEVGSNQFRRTLD